MAAELLTNFLHREVNIDTLVFVHPAVFDGQAHAVKHHAIEQFGIGGYIFEMRLRHQDLRDTEERILFCL